MLADGRVRSLSTGADGSAEIQRTAAGSHTVTSRFRGMTIDETLVFVAMGEAPSGGAATTGASRRPPRCIALVEEHRVRSGETLEGLARDLGLTVRELAQFNWGVSSPREIEARLRDEVGCTQRSDDGSRYVFDDSDEPGILYLPQTWDEAGLAHGERHTVRVRRIERRLPELRLRYRIDVDAPAAKDDTLTLTTEDGSWKHEIRVADVAESEPDQVELVFPPPPMGARLSLVQDPGAEGEPFYVFRGLTYGEVRQETLG